MTTTLADMAAAVGTTLAEQVHSPRCDLFASAVENLTDAQPFGAAGVTLLDIHREANLYTTDNLAACTCPAAASVRYEAMPGRHVATVRGHVAHHLDGYAALVAANRAAREDGAR